MVAFNQEMKTNVFESTFRTRKFYKEEERYQKMAMEILSIFDLAVYASEQAQNLPYGKQRKLEIARAMATHPKVLLLDEPAAGMNPTETHELMEMIEYIRSHYQIAILLIEHDMSLVMNICEHITVLEYGTPIAAGSPSEIANNQRVIQAYLGSGD
jgi:branched-chain amino acid transport system ATP-binding protein